MIVAAFLLSCVGGVESNAFHPARPDLFMEVPDVSGLVSKLGSAPAGRFVDDPDVQKLGALTQQLGYDLGALVRSAAPRLSDDPTPGPLFAPGTSDASRSRGAGSTQRKVVPASWRSAPAS